MTDPNQEYPSLDDLFRETFDNLPDTPARSGWDTPSDRVWNHVQHNIQPPRTGWTMQSIGLVAAFAVTLAVGLYLYTARPAVQQDAAQPAPAVTPVEVPSSAQPVASEPTPAVVSPTPSQPAAGKSAEKPQSAKPKPGAPANSAEKNAADTKRPSPTAAPLPGTQPVSPNSSERQRSEGGKNGGNQQ